MRKCGLNLTQVIIGQSVIPIVPLKEVIPVPDELGFELCGISDRQCGFERLGFSPTLNPLEVLIVVGSVADVWLSGWARPSRRCRDHRWCHSFRRQIATLVHRQKWVRWAGGGILLDRNEHVVRLLPMCVARRDTHSRTR